MAKTQPIRDKEDVRALAVFFLEKGELRNYALFMLGVHTALRISDILRLRWDDVYDFRTGEIIIEFPVVESKTKKPKTLALHDDAVKALKMLAAEKAAPGRFVIENAKTGKAISRVQAYRIIRAASDKLKFKKPVSCHSLRKTFGYHAWKDGVDHLLIMTIYNHSSVEITKLYICITDDAINKVYLNQNYAS